MIPPGGTSGLVISREAEFVRTNVGYGIVDGDYVAEYWKDDKKNLKRKSISEMRFRRTMEQLEAFELLSFGIIGAEDVADGVSYFVKLIRNGNENCCLVVNPQHCAESEMHQLARCLEKLLKRPWF